MSQDKNNQDNASDNRSARDIQSDLADSRMRVGHTLELLEDRFRPSVMFDQAWGYARAKSEDGTTSRFKETLVNNPLPAVLMGAGLAWMLMAGSQGSVPRSDSPLTAGNATDSNSSEPESGLGSESRSEPESATNRGSTSSTSSSTPSTDRSASGRAETFTASTSTQAATSTGANTTDSSTSNTSTAGTHASNASGKTVKERTRVDSKAAPDSQASRTASPPDTKIGTTSNPDSSKR